MHSHVRGLREVREAREQRRRRVVLLGIALLLVLSIGPVFGHHLSSRLDLLLAGRDHLWALCLVALHHLLAPVHAGFHGLVVVGVAYATWDRWRAWRVVRVSLRAVREGAVLLEDGFARAARQVGLDADRLRVVDGLPSPAFTVGWWRPRVYVARALVDLLPTDELAAVLAHERAHVMRRDPLRLSALRFLASVLFWLPALRRLSADAADEAEIVADDEAAARTGALTLASALVHLGAWRTSPTVARAAVGISSGFQHPELLARRVRRLVGETSTPTTHVTRRSIAGAALALALVWTSGVLMAHPLPGDSPTHGRHCEHTGDAALSHLFCRGIPLVGALASDCPHHAR